MPARTSSPSAGLELTFAFNHLALFLLTNLLLDRLMQGPARVVNIASNAHVQGRIDFNDLQGQRSYSGGQAYSQSRLASVMFTYELARPLRPPLSRSTPFIPDW